MKKFFIISASFLIMSSISICATRDLDKIFLDNIRKSFKEYKFNASWIIEECMLLKVPAFTQIFDELVDILTKSEKRWYYFCDKPKEFNDEAYWKYSLNQCATYDKWLRRLYVDIKSQEIFLINSKPNPQFVFIFDYWDMYLQAEEKKYQQFYAFYIDCLTHVFNEYVNTAKEYIGDQKNFSYYFALANNCLVDMEKSLSMLQASKQYSQYHLAITALSQIIILLEEENTKGR